MKYDGEFFVGTLFCKLIEEKIFEVTFDESMKAADNFLAEAKKTDPNAKLKVTIKDIKKACKKKKLANIYFDKNAKKVVFKELSINAYYQMHWSYEASALRLYGEDFPQKVLKAYAEG